MLSKRHVRELVSTSVLALALAPWMGLASAAQEPSETPAQSPSTGPATQSAQEAPRPSGREAAQTRADERRAAMDAEREKRYEELRQSAAQLGVDLPETPPWKSAESRRPPMPEGYGRRSPEERQAMRERREAMREERWKQMQADAAERGIEMPETPPWEDMEKYRQERAERYKAYRKTIDAMTDEQREAARAIFGRRSHKSHPHMPRTGYGYPYHDDYCGDLGHGMSRPPMPPPFGERPMYDQGPPPPPARQKRD